MLLAVGKPELDVLEHKPALLVSVYPGSLCAVLNYCVVEYRLNYTADLNYLMWTEHGK